jgi:CheY-like chemotaxis protein
MNVVAVLLVEDNPENRKEKLNLLREMNSGGPVVGVASSDDAIRALRTLPGFDLIIADISLPANSESDPSQNRDGIALIKWVRKVGYPALPVGYSGLFKEGELSKDDLSAFSDFVGRGAPPDEILTKLRRWLDDAANFRLRGRGAAVSRDTQVSPRHEFSEGVIPDTIIDLQEERSVKELIDDGFVVRVFSYRGEGDVKPFFVWVKEGTRDVFLEVFGQPRLYVSDIDLPTAQRSLLSLMRGYYRDLGSEEPDRLSHDLQKMVDFLRSIFR